MSSNENEIPIGLTNCNAEQNGMLDDEIDNQEELSKSDMMALV